MVFDIITARSLSIHHLRVMEIKTKINKWYLIKLKLLYNKRNQKKKKRENPQKERKIFANKATNRY